MWVILGNPFILALNMNSVEDNWNGKKKGQVLSHSIYNNWKICSGGFQSAKDLLAASIVVLVVEQASSNKDVIQGIPKLQNWQQLQVIPLRRLTRHLSEELWYSHLLPPFQNRWPNFVLKVNTKLGHLFWNGGSRNNSSTAPRRTIIFILKIYPTHEVVVLHQHTHWIWTKIPSTYWDEPKSEDILVCSTLTTTRQNIDHSTKDTIQSRHCA